MIGKTNSVAGGKLKPEKLNLTLKTNQVSHADLVDATFTVAYADVSTSYTWAGNEMLIEIPPYVGYSITFDNVANYKKPDVYTSTAVEGNSKTLEFEYKTELVSVTLSADDGSSVNGAQVTINGTTQTFNGSAVTQKVAFDTTYSVSVSDMDGFATPAAQTGIVAAQSARNLAFTYIASSLKVNISSNQGSDPTIAAVKATVSYGSTSVQVSSGEQIVIPNNQAVTITFPAVDGYLAPDPITFTNSNGGVAEKSGEYKTQILTVNVSGSGATPSGYTITGKNSSTGATLFTQTTSSGSYKIPWGTSYSVSASSLDGYDSVSSQTGTANSLSNTLSFIYVYNPVKDLSMFDIYGNAIQQTTANCYVIKEAGQYKFPLVFGNAIKNGATNSEAYTNNGGANSHDFVDYKGNVISSPYVEDSAYVVDELVHAQLTIADTEGVIENIEIIDGSPCRYIQFTVVSVPSTGANAILSYLDGEFEIAWSWHIWMWPYDLTPVEITNNTGVAYNILPVNLATKLDSDDAINSTTGWKNWFYQFGRPTPLLCPSAYNSTSNHASYGALSFTTASVASNIQMGIKNPTTFYKYSSSYNYDWFSSNSGKTYNLWDAACSATGCSDNDVKKSVYDPCPIGFHMPNGNAFTYFSTSNVVGSFANGWKFKRYSGDTTGVFFPASGYRNDSSGSLRSVGSNGYVWLSSAYSQDYAYYLDFYSGNVHPQNYYYRAYGFSVRPVQE